MFPGFVTAYKTSDGDRHVYFFHGIDDSGENEYNDLDLSKFSVVYTVDKKNDGAIDIIIKDNISDVTANMIPAGASPDNAVVKQLFF